VIPPKDALDLVRAQLRSELFDRLAGDDYGQSVLVAAIGVLTEVGRRVVESDAWCEPSVVALRAAATSWPASLTRDLVERSRAATSLGTERTLLLEAAEAVLTGMWAREAAQRDARLIGELRTLLAADTALEVTHAGRKT
jgi:hypothetical protein